MSSSIASSSGAAAPELKLADGLPTQQADWFEQARRGDRAAFARLAQSLQDRLFNAVSRMVAQPADALDVTQETFTKALEKIGDCRGESQPYTWLFRIAMNCAISRRRKETVRRATSIDAESRNSGGDDQMSSLRQRLASSAPAPTEVAQKRETAEQVRIALSRLEPEERALLVMRDVDDMDYAAMAEVLEVPLGTLKSRLFRARVALRNEIESMDAPQAKRGSAK